MGVLNTNAWTVIPRGPSSGAHFMNSFSREPVLASVPSLVKITITGQRSSPFLKKRSSSSSRPSISTVPAPSVNRPAAVSFSFLRSVVGGTRTRICRPVVIRMTSSSGGSASRNAIAPARMWVSAGPAASLVSSISAIRIGSVAGPAFDTTLA